MESIEFTVDRASLPYNDFIAMGVAVAIEANLGDGDDQDSQLRIEKVTKTKPGEEMPVGGRRVWGYRGSTIRYFSYDPEFLAHAPDYTVAEYPDNRIKVEYKPNVDSAAVTPDAITTTLRRFSQEIAAKHEAPQKIPTPTWRRVLRAIL